MAVIKVSTHLLTIALLILASASHSASTENRVLIVRDGSSEHQYSIQELSDAIGIIEMKVARDPHFGPDRIFAGFALKSLLDHIGLGDAPELMLVCEDGYRIAFDATILKKREVNGMLALRDNTLPADAKKNWEPYRHGSEMVDFDPFYIVWSGDFERYDPATEALPWPYQLTEIQRLDRDTYFKAAEPPAGSDEALMQGFTVYKEHCGKCHRIRDVGGDVGPVLDRENSLSSLLTMEQLKDFVLHDEKLYPQSKMPPYSKLLTPAELDGIVAYLQAMQHQ